MEAHHIGGRQNGDLTVDIPANDHRVLSDMQQDWSTETLRNPTGSPLIAVAATLRGWLDVLKLLIDRAVGWIPDALESLDACIQAALGEWWWEQREFAAFTAAVRGVLHA